MKIGDIVELKITSINENARGVGFYEGFRVEVADTLIDEVVTAKLKKKFENTYFAELHKIIEPSKNRTRPKCPYTKVCGGCQLQHINYDEQLTLKQNLVKEALDEFNVEVEKTVGVYYPYEYRNKIHFAITEKNKQAVVGFYEEGTKNVVDIPECVLHHDWAKKLYNIIHEYIRLSKIELYDQETGYGLLRYVTARFVDGSIQVTVVLTKRKFIKQELFYKLLTKEFKTVSLYLNINPRTDAQVYGDEFIFVDGEKMLNATIMGLQVSLFPTSFLQVNLPIATKIYKKVLEQANVKNGSTVIDLFSGIGITSLFFAKNGANVTSIELEKSSVLEAKRLVKVNNLTSQINILQGDAGVLLKEVIKNPLNQKEKIIFVDPPRKGLEKAAQLLLDSNATKIIYLSCNPYSLKDDLAILTKQYRIVSITPYDMFPQTKHIETLVELKRI